MNEEPKPIFEVDSEIGKINKNLRGKIWKAIKAFSIFEKIAFSVAVILVLFTGYLLVNESLNQISTKMPAAGGTLTEAATDFSRFINPILARSETDKDLTALIYSGLLKLGADNALKNDLASSTEKSEDGLVYTIVLKNNLQFHDKAPLTADDVIFTIQKIKDANIKSPLAGNWSGITIKKIDDKTIQFNLPQAYEPFEENLTVGILPAHLWASSSPDTFDISPLNRKPIGSGPYKISSVTETSPGVISEYKLVAFDGYAEQKPYITNYNFNMYKDEESAIKAVAEGKANIISGISIENLRNNKGNLLRNRVLYAPLLPRTYSVFFNQSNSTVLLNPEVRLALSKSIDRTDLIKNVRDGYGIPTNSPIPGQFIDFASSTPATTTDAITQAQNILIAKGWTKGEDGIFQKQITLNKVTSTQKLAFHISTSNSPELKLIAQYVANIWKQVGVDVDVQIYDSSDLAEKVVGPRKYDVLLFGQVIGRDWDLYPFWHSSQQRESGLNLAMYANKKVDSLLETLRATSTQSVQETAVASIASEINKDNPVVFLYSPQYLFIMPDSIKGIEMSSIDNSSERFYQVNHWYINTKRILNAFNKK